MVEAKIAGTIGRNIEPKFDEGKKLEKIFKKRFPKTYRRDVKERDILRKYTSGGVDFPEEIYRPYNFVNGLAIKGGFSEVVINPNDEATVCTFVPFNTLVLPEKYLINLNDLLTSASPDYPGNFVTKGMELIIEQQDKFKKGKAFKSVIESCIKKEASLGISEKAQSVLAEIFELKKQKNSISELSFSKQLSQKDVEYIKLTKEEIKKVNEQSILDEYLPMIARSQFIEKIKRDPKRDVVNEISTVESLIDILELGVMNGTQIKEEIVDTYMRERYPDPILDAATRKAIVIKQSEIRKNLKDSY